MVNPKSLLFHLHKHWEVVDILARASRELPSFSEAQILAAVGKVSSVSDLDERAGVLRALSNADILQRLPRSSELQLNPLVLEFVRGLTREHELGLSSVLQARVEALREATQELNEGVEHENTDQLRTAAARLSELLRQISQQLDQDRHAILELAEQAKSGGWMPAPVARLPLSGVSLPWALIMAALCQLRPVSNVRSMTCRPRTTKEWRDCGLSVGTCLSDSTVVNLPTPPYHLGE